MLVNLSASTRYQAHPHNQHSQKIHNLCARLLVRTSAAVSTGGALVSVAQSIDPAATHVVEILRLHVDSAQLVAQCGSLDVLHLGNLNSLMQRK